MHRRRSPSWRSRENDTAANDDDDVELQTQHDARKPMRRPAACILAVLGICLIMNFSLVRHRRPTNVAWKEFAQDYQRRYTRAPPDMLKQWLDFAVTHKCETKRYYNTIEQDLKAFRNKKLHYDRVVEEVTNYSNYHVVIRIEHNKLKFVKWNRSFDMSWLKMVENLYLRYAIRWLLRPLVNHKPPIRTTFVLNLHDRPTGRKNATLPIFSSCHVSHHNDNLVYENRTTTMIQTDDTVTRDAVVPYYFSIGPIGRGLWFWPFYTKGPEWKQRKNGITWRGSTTGEWERSPRFWLLQQYGGMHSLAGVDVDFAFVRVVQSPQGQELPSKYRQAESMSYRDIQRHKYVLDVDGNGTFRVKQGNVRTNEI